MIKLAQVCITCTHVYHDGKASSAFCMQKKESQLFIIQLKDHFMVLQLKRAPECRVSSAQSEMAVKGFFVEHWLVPLLCPALRVELIAFSDRLTCFWKKCFHVSLLTLLEVPPLLS